MLVPPGIAMILYGVSAGASVGKLFMSGLSVGVLIAVVFSAFMSVLMQSRNKMYRGKKPATFKGGLTGNRQSILHWDFRSSSWWESMQGS